MSVESEMTKQETKEPHIPVESSKMWLKSLGPSILQTLIEAGNDEGIGKGMSDSLVALGHPLIELMGGFYTQKVTFKTKWVVSLVFEGAQRVKVLPIFARSVEDVRNFVVNGTLFHVCLTRKEDLDNFVVGGLITTKFSKTSFLVKHI
ncbi:hypothetical protein ACFX2B_012061 [Malus domestica]